MIQVILVFLFLGLAWCMFYTLYGEGIFVTFRNSDTKKAAMPLSKLCKWLLFKFNYCSSTVVSILLQPQPSSVSTLDCTLFWFCPCVLYTCPSMTLPLLSPVIPLPYPSGYCQFVLYFNVSGNILLTCLFCWLGSTYRWDHTVFVYHCLAYFT